MSEARNDAIYLRLLTGTPPASLRDSFRPLLDRQPNVLAYRSTLALLELRSGNSKRRTKFTKAGRSTGPPPRTVFAPSALPFSRRPDTPKKPKP